MQYLMGLRQKPERLDIEGQVFTTETLHKLNQPTPPTLKVRSLTGIVQYVQQNYDKQPSMLIHVESPVEVSIYSTYNRDMHRNHYVQSTAMLPSIPFDVWMDTEKFNVKLQSCFVPTDTRNLILSIVGNIVEEHVKNTTDDGVSQTVVAKKGVGVVGNVIVPNPVVLKPFRTFSEISQPESPFILRLQEGPSCGLFEADGGAWRITVMQSIKAYLDTELSAEIEGGAVTIIA